MLFVIIQLEHIVTFLFVYLKGVWHEIIESVSPMPLSILLGLIRIFSQIRGEGVLLTLSIGQCYQYQRAYAWKWKKKISIYKCKVHLTKLLTK